MKYSSNSFEQTLHMRVTTHVSELCKIENTEIKSLSTHSGRLDSIFMQ